MKVIDTSIAVDHLRGKREAVELLERLVVDDEPVASEVVRFELLAGVRDSELTPLEEFFRALTWVPVEEGTTRVAGELARRYRRRFSGIDTADYVIAATAILLGSPLLTTNVRHFPMFEDLRPPY